MEKTTTEHPDAKQGMDFKAAVNAMLGGYKVKLPEWEGYWQAWENGGAGESTSDAFIRVHTKDGEDLYTPHLKYMLRDDWQIVG